MRKFIKPEPPYVPPRKPVCFCKHLFLSMKDEHGSWHDPMCELYRPVQPDKQNSPK